MDDGGHPHHPWVMAEGPLCRAGLGLGPKGPNPSRVAKSGPVGFGPFGRHVVTIPSLRQIPSLRPIPRALKLGEKIDQKKVLNWAKKSANFEASLRNLPQVSKVLVILTVH